MQDLVLITGPAAEPVTLAEVKLQLGFSPMEDSDHVKSRMLSEQLRGLISAARGACEDYTRRVFLRQTWLLKLDGFPGYNPMYSSRGYPEILVPKPPFQAVVSLQYVDIAGQLQILPVTDQGGNTPDGEMYGYQLDPGSETQPARLSPPWARPWPPTRLIPSCVLFKFVAGYGGPLTASMTAASAAIAGPTFLPGDVGRALAVPGAGASGATLNTAIAAVDDSGNATAANVAVATVANVTAWFGDQVPMQIRTAIKFQVQHLYENSGPHSAGAGDVALSPVARALLDGYRNLVA